MNNTLLYIGGLLIVVLGALFAGPVFVDWNRYREVFEAEASHTLGREVRVGGPIKLRLLPVPTMRFERVRIADPDAPFSEPVLRAESFTIWLSVPPLLKGAFEANEIELTRPILRLTQDGQGGGNWQSLTRVGARSPYLPRDVALQSVKISDGTVSLHAADGTERVRFEAINGELSAPALEGPYRLRSAFKWQGSEREIRMSTARPDADGRVRFKGSVSAAADASSWILEGVAADPLGRPRIEGELTAKLPIAVTSRDRAAVFDLKSRFNGDSHGFALADLALSFEQDGRPQIVTGDVRADWRVAMNVEMRLAAKWLDLDRIAGPPAADSVLGSFQALLGRLSGLFPDEGQATCAVALDQASIGGDRVSGVAMRLVKSGPKLVLESLEAGLPGNSRIEAKGIVTPALLPRFDGEVQVRGASLTRLLGWAMKGVALPDLQGDSAFALRSEVSLGPQELSLRAATIELASSRLGGATRYRWGTTRNLDIDMEGDVLDLTPWRPAGLKFKDLSELVMALGSQPGPVSGGQGTGAGRAELEIRARLHIGRLLAGEQALRDVVLDGSLRSGLLDIKTLRFEAAEGMSVGLEGRIGDVGSKPKGRFAGVVAAETPAGVRMLLDVFGLPPTPASVAPGDLAGAAPLRLAVTAHLDHRREGTFDLSLDGKLKDSKVELTALLDGSPTNWQRAGMEISGAIAGVDVATLWRLPAGAPRAANPSSRGNVLIKLVGPGADALQSLIAITTPAGRATYRGALALSGAGPARWDGTLDVHTQDAKAFAATLGLEHRLDVEAVTARGTLDLSSNSERLRIESRGFEIAGREVAGFVSITGIADRRRVDGQVRLSTLGIGTLLQATAPARGRTATADPVPAGIWSDQLFDLAAFDGSSGRLLIEVDRLALTQALGITGAVLEVGHEPGLVEIKSIKGSALGGSVSGSLKMRRAAAGLGLDGQFAIANARLDALGLDEGGKAFASGTASLRLSFAGNALSPRGLAAALTGNGSLDLGPSFLERLPSGTLTEVVSERLSGRVPDGVEGLTAVIRSRIGQGRVPLGPRRIPLLIGDGALKAGAFAIDGPEGRLTTVTTIDLMSLMVDSEWRMEALGPVTRKGGGPAATALPPVTVAFVGPLGEWSRLETRIDAAALERELIVLRMERDVQELERLRKFDEERGRQEGERQRVLEQLRALERKRASEPIPGEQLAPAVPGVGAPAAQAPGAPTQPPVPEPVPAAELRRRPNETRQVPSSSTQTPAQKQREIFDRAFGRQP